MRVAEPPRLETARLVLRGFRDADFEAHAAMAADPEVMRHLGGVADRPQAWRQLALYAGHWTLRGYGNWAVERRSDGAYLGRAGLWNPEGWPGVELGWALARHAWGHGYATEAARAALAWAWASLDVPRLLSIVAPGNDASPRERMNVPQSTLWGGFRDVHAAAAQSVQTGMSSARAKRASERPTTP